MKKLFILFLASLFSFSSFSQDSVASKRIELSKTSSEQILQDEGNTVAITGFVKSTQVNAAGIHFLEFKDNAFSCVTFARNVKNFPDGPPSEVYKEKWVEVTGPIEKYRGQAQMQLASPDQVKIIDAPAPPAMTEKVPAGSEDQTALNASEAPKTEAPKTEEPAAEAITPVVAAPPAQPGRVVEVIDGVEALDWRTFFPE